MRVKLMNAKTRSRFLVMGLFLIGVSTAAGLTQPPVEIEEPGLDRATVSAEAPRAGHCDRAG